MILFKQWEEKEEYRTNSGFIKARKFKDLALVETNDQLQQRYLMVVKKFKMYQGSMPSASPSPSSSLIERNKSKRNKKVGSISSQPKPEEKKPVRRKSTLPKRRLKK